MSGSFRKGTKAASSLVEVLKNRVCYAKPSKWSLVHYVIGCRVYFPSITATEVQKPPEKPDGHTLDAGKLHHETEVTLARRERSRVANCMRASVVVLPSRTQLHASTQTSLAANIQKHVRLRTAHLLLFYDG